jgi:hypothetical protein
MYVPPYIIQLGWSSEPATAASSSLQPVEVSQCPRESVEDPFTVIDFGVAGVRSKSRNGASKVRDK